MLYVQGRAMRLVQEAVLGIGGVRALRACGIEPSVWHINEGHSALLQLERMAEHLKGGGAFADAREAVARCVRVTRVVEPRAEWVERYAGIRPRFRRLYPSLRAVMAD